MTASPSDRTQGSPWSRLGTKWRRNVRKVSEPTVSVIIPTYNCAAYLPRAIDSMLHQGSVPIEVIVVDDASTDETPSLLASHYGGNPVVRVVRHAENRGLGSTRNTGLDAARGEYVFFLDADDWVEPGILERLTSLAAGSEAEIIACGVRLAYDDGRVEPYHAHAFECAGGREALRELIKYRIGSIVWNKLYLRSFIERNHLRFIDLFKEDVIFSTEAVFLCRRFLSIDDVYHNYFQRRDSIIRSTPTTTHLRSFIRQYLDIARFIERHRLDADPEGAEIARGLFWAHCSGDLFPKLVTYIRTRPQEQWEAECWSVLHELLGAGGYAVADVLIRAMQDSSTLAAARNSATPSP